LIRTIFTSAARRQKSAAISRSSNGTLEKSISRPTSLTKIRSEKILSRNKPPALFTVVILRHRGSGGHRPAGPVGRWQRFAESGVEGLLRDKTRKPGKAPIARTALPAHFGVSGGLQLTRCWREMDSNPRSLSGDWEQS
jgi:hypothetical protein